MPSKRDYYDILGVARDASEDDVRRAFRKLARQYHPDINREAGAEDAFKEANEAYEVLSDTERRAQYDRFGHDGPQGFGAGQPGFGGFGFEDIFDSFFGGMRSQTRRPQRGSDLRFDIQIAFEEAVFGVERTIDVSRQTACSRCHGTGGEPGTHRERCPACNGSGEIRRVQQSLFGQFVNVMVCERCRGEGQIVTSPCQHCRGHGIVRTQAKLAVNVPAGIDDGQQIRLSGEGESGPNGLPPGDLYVAIHVKPHAQFKRQGTDLLFDMTINVAQAALGAEIPVPTVEGTPYKLKVPAGTQYAKVFRIRERGVPYLRGGGRGDLMVRIYVAVPTTLSPDQRRLFADLSRSFGTLPADETGRPVDGAGSPNGTSHGDDGDRPASRPGAGRQDRGRSSKRDKGLFGKVKDALGGE